MATGHCDCSTTITGIVVKNRDQDLEAAMNVGGGGDGGFALIHPDMFFCEKVCSVDSV